MQFDPDEIKDAVVSKLVEKFDDEAGLNEVVRNELRDAVKKYVTTTMAGLIQTEVRRVIDETLGAPIQQTDNWGEAKGEKKPLRDHLIAEVGRILALQVDGYNGNLGTYKASKFEDSLLGWVVKRVADAHVKTHFGSELVKATTAAKAEIVGIVLARAQAIADRAAKGQL